MAIVNIAVYIMTRMKYEQQMSMMELIVLVIDAGKRLTKEKCAGPVQKELEEKLKELGKLDKLIGKMSAMRRNSYSSDQGVFLDYLFGITLWQLISYEKSVKWLENKRESYLQLFEEIGRWMRQSVSHLFGKVFRFILSRSFILKDLYTWKRCIIL